MTLNELEAKYTGQFVNEEKISETFTYMGKFGRVIIYMFTFETEHSVVRTEVCLKAGKIIGFTPEKEPLQDVWGFTAEDYEEDVTEEELARIHLYLASVLA